MKSAWIGIGFSHQSVPSLSKTATRSSTGTGSEPFAPVTLATKSMIRLADRPVAPTLELGTHALDDRDPSRRASSPSPDETPTRTQLVNR